MSEEDTRAIMDGNATLAHYIRTNAFDEIYAAIRPHVENLANDTSFAKSYKNAMGSEIGENFVSEFTNELLNDAFDTLVQNENEFRANTNAVFNAIKAIR